MSRNALYLGILIVAVLAVGGGYWMYQEQNKPGVEIRVGGNGVSIQQR